MAVGSPDSRPDAADQLRALHETQDRLDTVDDNEFNGVALENDAAQLQNTLRDYAEFDGNNEADRQNYESLRRAAYEAAESMEGVSGMDIMAWINGPSLATSMATLNRLYPEGDRIRFSQLRQNSEAVMAIQSIARDMGLEIGVGQGWGENNDGVDGDYGGMTFRAVMAIQQRLGVEPDGYFGSRTLDALKTYLQDQQLQVPAAVAGEAEETADIRESASVLGATVGVLGGALLRTATEAPAAEVGESAPELNETQKTAITALVAGEIPDGSNLAQARELNGGVFLTFLAEGASSMDGGTGSSTALIQLPGGISAQAAEAFIADNMEAINAYEPGEISTPALAETITPPVHPRVRAQRTLDAFIEGAGYTIAENGEVKHSNDPDGMVLATVTINEEGKASIDYASDDIQDQTDIAPDALQAALEAGVNGAWTARQAEIATAAQAEQEADLEAANERVGTLLAQAGRLQYETLATLEPYTASFLDWFGETDPVSDITAAREAVTVAETALASLGELRAETEGLEARGIVRNRITGMLRRLSTMEEAITSNLTEVREGIASAERAAEREQLLVQRETDTRTATEHGETAQRVQGEVVDLLEGAPTLANIQTAQERITQLEGLRTEITNLGDQYNDEAGSDDLPRSFDLARQYVNVAINTINDAIATARDNPRPYK